MPRLASVSSSAPPPPPPRVDDPRRRRRAGRPSSTRLAGPVPVAVLSWQATAAQLPELRHQVAACAAAAGCLVVTGLEGMWGEAAARTASGAPAVILVPHEEPGPEDSSGPAVSAAVPWASVIPDGTAAPTAVAGRHCFTVPAQSDELARWLATLTASSPHPSAPPHPTPTGPETGPQDPDPVAGPCLAVVHRGAGPHGDDDWPGLSWAITVLTAGAHRGVLVDAQDGSGSLSDRLPTPGGARGESGGTLRTRDRLVWQDLTDAGTGRVPVPGAGLRMRLPLAGPVRWLGHDPTRMTSGDAGRARRWLTGSAAVLPAVLARTFAVTVVDCGADTMLAQQLISAGAAGLVCTRSTAAAPGRGAGTGWFTLVLQDGDAGRVPGTITVPGDLFGSPTLASWSRAVRRRAAVELGAHLALRLDRVGRGGTASAGTPPMGRRQR